MRQYRVVVKSNSVLCGDLDGQDEGGGIGGRSRREGIYVYI